MKSIERRFVKLQQSRLGWSSYMCFAGAVGNGRFSPSSIRRWFHRLVEKDDYCQEDKRAIFAYLDTLSNPLRTTGIEGTYAFRASLISNQVVARV